MGGVPSVRRYPIPIPAKSVFWLNSANPDGNIAHNVVIVVATGLIRVVCFAIAAGSRT